MVVACLREALIAAPDSRYPGAALPIQRRDVARWMSRMWRLTVPKKDVKTNNFFL
jgi:hypothetical protein